MSEFSSKSLKKNLRKSFEHLRGHFVLEIDSLNERELTSRERVE